MAKRKKGKQPNQGKQRGGISQMIWLIGLAVVGVFILVVFGIRSGSSEITLQTSQTEVQTIVEQDAPISEEVSAEQNSTIEAIAALSVEPRVGSLAPDFSLVDLSGQEVSLSDFRGQPVVVSFFHSW